MQTWTSYSSATATSGPKRPNPSPRRPTSAIEEQNGTFSQTFDDHESIFGYFTWQDRVGATEDDSGFKQENGTWKETYRLINVANNIINEVPKIPQATAQEKAGALRVNGEAHFLRALYYFWLARTDLGVPIKIFPEVKDQRFRRNTVQEVYDQILADLQVAESSLNQSEPRKTIYRADSTAVNLLLSRVYLSMQRRQSPPGVPHPAGEPEYNRRSLPAQRQSGSPLLHGRLGRDLHHVQQLEELPRVA